MQYLFTGKLIIEVIGFIHKLYLNDLDVSSFDFFRDRHLRGALV